MGRSIMAVVVGFLVIGALAFGMDAVMMKAVPDAFGPNDEILSVPVMLFMMLYVALFAITGCYITARLAPNRPMRHALILGALGLAFNIMGSVQMWDRAPAWFHIVNILMVMPYAWMGGRIREKQLGLAVV